MDVVDVHEGDGVTPEGLGRMIDMATFAVLDARDRDTRAEFAAGRGAVSAVGDDTGALVGAVLPRTDWA